MVTTVYNTSPEHAKAEKITRTDEQKLKEACQGFESIFMHQMLKSMRSATMDGGFIKKSNAEKIFTDMLDQEYADLSSKNNVGGIADMMFEQLKTTLNRTSTPDKKPEHAHINGYKPEGKKSTLNIEG